MNEQRPKHDPKLLAASRRQRAEQFVDLAIVRDRSIDERSPGGGEHRVHPRNRLRRGQVNAEGTPRVHDAQAKCRAQPDQASSHIDRYATAATAVDTSSKARPIDGNGGSKLG